MIKDKLVYYNKILLTLFFVFQFFSCISDQSKKKKINVDILVGNYEYKRSKSIGDYNIAGEWTLKITKNSDNEFLYNYCYTTRDEINNYNPYIVQQVNGKFGQITTVNRETRWYLSGELSDCYIVLSENETLISTPNLLTFENSKDTKYFSSILASNEAPKIQSQSNNRNDLTKKFNLKNFDALNFIFENSTSINKCISNLKGDYVIIRNLNNYFTKSLRNKILIDSLGEMNSSEYDFQKILSDIKNGAPIYEVFIEWYQSDLFQNLSYVNNIYERRYLLFFSGNEFHMILDYKLSNCDFLLNIYNSLSVFKNENEFLTKNDNVIEIRNKMEFPTINDVLKYKPQSSYNDSKLDIGYGKIIPIYESLWHKNINKLQKIEFILALTIQDKNSAGPSPITSENKENVDNNEVETDKNLENNINESGEGNYITKADKNNYVYFYTYPEESTKRNAHFDSHELVYVQRIENGFGYVEFTNSNGQKSKGWIRLNDLTLKQ